MIVLRRSDGAAEQIRDAQITIGRDPDCRVSFAQSELDIVSRRHARIQFRGEWYEIVDEGSHNGTFVNGRKVEGAVQLREGDVIQLGYDIGPKLEVHFEYDRERYARKFSSSASSFSLIWVLLVGLMLLIVLAFAYLLFG
jgi:pSer/pThr/pTyr-binding forkhead associated (FHA) protein